MIDSVFFFCLPPGAPDQTPYHHEFVALAEGLHALNVPAYSNVPYWKTAEGFLLDRCDADFRDCGVVVVDSIFHDLHVEHLLPDDLFSPHRNYRLVYCDTSDGEVTPCYGEQFRHADIVLKSHYNGKYQQPANFVPWQFGLTNRIIESVAPVPFSERRREFLVNYRVRHQLRTLAQRTVTPRMCALLHENDTVDGFADTASMDASDYSFWCQTGRRHYPANYRRLSGAFACFAFGGHLMKFFSGRRNVFEKLLYAIDWRLPVIPYDRIYQFDSWRFWESLVAGCCTFHVDLERYGAVFPVMPVNGEHYIGIDFSDVETTLRMLERDPGVFERVGNAGRRWVLEHYAPEPVARRFTALLGG